MPPKRKAASSNSSSKVAKAAANATPASSTDIAGGDVNFSNANTLSKKRSYIVLDWKSTDYDDEDEEDDEDGEDDKAEEDDEDATKNDGNGRKDQKDKRRGKDLDLPNPGQKFGEEWCSRVSDIGFPISQDGVELAQKLDKERDKRNQDPYDVHIYNDFNGYGSSEAVQNF
ncbi:uncharacterized protein EAF01_006316 [Botrytis porri]|uniref:uncharacterized protein n=1 Tax=Botrytis porri TaxID=87229 RepID=UPI001902166C|nr:uncharacterized protein EAF01_006316 [Botrytis porri]KAF7903267.1 hypothetical protein EAF01_006316 [Botrytis porri]